MLSATTHYLTARGASHCGDGPSRAKLGGDFTNRFQSNRLLNELPNRGARPYTGNEIDMLFSPLQTYQLGAKLPQLYYQPNQLISIELKDSLVLNKD